MRADFADQADNFAIIELLEPRRLLSAALAWPIIEPASRGRTHDLPAVEGLSPKQVRAAYGFDQITFSGGVKGDGAGQTIAIVAAYNHPNIIADLKRFDAQFGLPDPPKFTIVNQNGSGRLPRTDAAWAIEIALDVEWAHAIAPGANILLVEANSAGISDLMAAVDYARKAPGVSVVSMSWGGNEFSRETSYDSFFTTPSGHNGVSFVTASGDDGSWDGAEWPSASPNVISVGGTKLNLNNAAGTYGNETGWAGSGGGISAWQRAPAYQLGVQSTGHRTTPDVAYNGSPASGVAIYCSIADYGGHAGWSEVGGTSSGTPQWAGLLAIANQGRAINKQSSLDGATQTLPGLYSAYSRPASSGYGKYTSMFHDVTTGSSSQTISATPGYDMVTGLGTPRADKIVAALTSAALPKTVPAKSMRPAYNASKLNAPWPWWYASASARMATSAVHRPFSTTRIIAARPARPAAVRSLAKSRPGTRGFSDLFGRREKADLLA